MYPYIKRIIDIIISILIMPIFATVYIIVSLAIKKEDKGPVFYLGERLGENTKVFKMYKFRSMKLDAPDLRNEDGSTFNSKDDIRVTKIGKFLRESSIDELPQIINVLKGDMSFVGPRASLGNSLGTFQNDELRKFKVKPGITGYNQAYFRNSLSLREKRLRDVEYVENMNFLLDLKILIKTVKTVIKKESLYVDYKKNNV
jgi:undecaprenyl phosphate N,N'-diacetylbacillosamine 1-phosphate transferase